MIFKNKYMLRSVLTILFLFFINYSNVIAQFRSTTWGMSSDKVKEVETIVTEIDGNLGERILVSNSVINGLEALVAYYIIEDTLYKARYVINEDYTNRNQFVDDYKSISAILSTKYGYQSIYYDWSDELYKDDRSDYGFAVSLGHLKLITNFKDDTTEIFHLLEGNDYEISHILEYRSKEYVRLEDALSNKKIMNDF